MADLYLSRKSAISASPLSDIGIPKWFSDSPTIHSKISRTSRASAVTTHAEDNVEELEMLLEVIKKELRFLIVVLMEMLKDKW